MTADKLRLPVDKPGVTIDKLSALADKFPVMIDKSGTPVGQVLAAADPSIRAGRAVLIICTY
ncbi:hypothetical protein OYT88_07750 [Sporolactobacillus sp. CQH2019]|uniref:hypothetical protein n=1 Tax=Sporolactobacillus sp. CQH2019 TaxID=3023512 RepID=UPI002368C653|nr:hypothetical protein [Sporolactobacillus sp. CQH2019]MDD9148441.1 hypothetical protein [Sporolactobacillus sp. CQH2019]